MMPPETAPFPPPAFNDALPRPLKTWRARLGAGLKASVVPLLVVTAFVVPPPSIMGGHNGRILNLPSLCLFYNLTGLPCPGCGITRSCVCFAHGRWVDSLVYHPLGPLTFLVLCLFALRPLLRVRVSERVSSAAAYVATGLFIAFWIARLCHVLPSVPAP